MQPLLHTPGDAVVLLEPNLVRPQDARDEAALGELIEVLTERHFVRSWMRVERTLAATLADALKQSTHGVLIRVDHAGLLHAHGGASALLTCRTHAHLALSVVAERGGRFAAHAIGRVREREVQVVCGDDVLARSARELDKWIASRSLG